MVQASLLTGIVGKTCKRLLLLTAMVSTLAFAREDQPLLTEPGTPPFIHTFGQGTFSNGAELIISGNNNSDSQQVLIVRIDNENSTDYRSRVNKEFSLAPGSFQLILPLSGLKTPARQPLAQPYSRLFVFAADRWAEVELDQVLISFANELPEDTLALDFGSKSSAAFPGFAAIGKGNAYLSGKTAERVRTSGDALVRDGVVGLKGVQIPWPDGQWQLSLWTRDQGEWEYLPHYLKRKISANGTVLVDEKWTPTQWIDQVYLAGGKKEGGIDGDLWSLVGERRSGFISKTIEVTDGIVNISLDGDYDARYLSALVLEPVSGSFATTTQAERRERFLNRWPVTASPHDAPASLLLSDISEQVQDDDGFYAGARDTLLNLTFEIASPVDDPAPVIVVSAPKSASGHSLTTTSRYGHWRYERPSPNATSLILDDSYLRADMASLRLSNEQPRRIHVQVAIPPGAKPGEYSGKIQLFSLGELRILDYHVRVLPVTLPELSASVGLYLEPAPFYQWFKPLREQAEKATSCDLSLLSKHGFSTVAPALVTPGSDTAQQQFIDQLEQVRRFGFDGPLLAYTPLKRLLRNKSEFAAGASLLKLKALLDTQDYPEIHWSIFDEPAKDRFEQIKDTADMLKEPSLAFKSAGHMNKEHQNELAGVTDLLLINHGTSVTKEGIERLQEESTVWLYNMPRPELAAGLYLWRSGADGYLQWHGRMPTADPFDPTDGREGDVVYLYPAASPCPATLAIHRRLLDLHEATIDLRWLQWLETVSAPQAEQLLNELRNTIPQQWQRMASMTAEERLAIRRNIISTGIGDFQAQAQTGKN